MAKGWKINRAFNSPSAEAWISPDTAHLVDEMDADERQHHIDTGNIEEVELPDDEAASAPSRPTRRRSKRGGK